MYKECEYANNESGLVKYQFTQKTVDVYSQRHYITHLQIPGRSHKIVGTMRNNAIQGDTCNTKS